MHNKINVARCNEIFLGNHIKVSVIFGEQETPLTIIIFSLCNGVNRLEGKWVDIWGV